MSNPKKFQTWNVLIISISHFVHDVYSSFLAPILPTILEKLELNFTMVGVLGVIQRIPNVLNPFVGILADKVHLRYFVIVAPAITTISMSLIGLASNVLVLSILLFVMGISAAAFHVPAPVMVKKISADKIGKGMSFFMVGGELARTVAPLIIVWAVSAWTLEGTYKLIPFGILASIILYLKLRNISVSEEIKEKQSGILQAFKENITFFLMVAGSMFFLGLMKSSLTFYLPLYFKEKGENLWFGASSLTVLQFSGMFGAYFAGVISDKIGRIRTLYIIVIATPLIMWLFVNSEGVYVFPLLLLIGFFIISSTPVFLALVLEKNSPHAAFMNGVYMTINFLIGAIVSLFIGIMADRIGLQKTFGITPFLGLLAIPFVYFLKKNLDAKV